MQLVWKTAYISAVLTCEQFDIPHVQTVNHRDGTFTVIVGTSQPFKVTGELKDAQHAAIKALKEYMRELAAEMEKITIG